MRRWWTLFVLVALAGFVSLAVFLTLRRTLLFPRHLIGRPPAPDIAALGGESLLLESDEGPLEMWFLPGQGISAETPGPAVLFAHGNAELIDDWPLLLKAYRTLGVSVALPEYRGYGRSPGTPSEQAIIADFTRAFDKIAARPDVDASRIVLHGRSIGGGVVCGVARQRRPAAVILQSTFTSIADMARQLWIPAFLARDSFDNLACVRALDVPMLIVHVKRDTLIPASHAERLHRAARNAELALYDADHNDCPPLDSTFWNDVQQLLIRARVLSQ